MNWDKLKTYKFDHVTVTIYRSIFRKWLVEVEYKDGQVPSQLVFEEEAMAWRRFYEAAQTFERSYDASVYEGVYDE